MSNPLGNLSENLPEIGSEPIIGWRQWSICGADLMSMSSNNTLPWDYLTPFEARCEAQLLEKEEEGHDAPFRDCTCGIYAAKTLADLNLSGYKLINVNDEIVVGSVKLWGKIIPHQRGYRAQYAYPNLILCPNPLVADLIARNYRCEVIIPEIEERPAEARNETFPIQNLFLDPGILAADNIKGVTINFQVNGQYFQYNGPFDNLAVGRWFSSILASMTKNGFPNYAGQYHQIQISFQY